MDWDSLLTMLKTFVGNDPTMVLLLTLAFFFLKNLWPTPVPASQQVLDGFAARIRKALELGDLVAAKRLADEGVDKTAVLLQAEAEPKPKGILDIFTTLFASPTMMPLMMIGGVFLLLMITGGGGCGGGGGGCAVKKTVAAESMQTFLSGAAQAARFSDYNTGRLAPCRCKLNLGETDECRPAIFELDSARGLVRTCAYEQPGVPEPWAWTRPDETGTGLSADRRGSYLPDSGTGGDLRECGPPPVVVDQGSPTADRGPGCYRCNGAASVRAGPVARVARFAWRPVARAAVGVARVGRWFRLPGRPFARLLRWRR